MRLIFVTYVFILSSLLSCKKKEGNSQLSKLKEPIKNIKLVKELNEISGLTFLNHNSIACIQDEKAQVFILDPKNGEIKHKYDFGKNNDYEGITHNDSKFYILQSDGNIFISENEQKGKKYHFKDNKKFDFEGLCLDKKNNRLLIACKEHAKKENKNTIFIYGFSLLGNQFIKKPVFKIDKKEINKNFMPSGIAIHPNGNIFILSSHSKNLLVLDSGGHKKKLYKLNKNLFNQPEGICFDKEGNLFISNEKKDSYPTLLKFSADQFFYD